MTDLIYFDNNGTTFMSPVVIKAMSQNFIQGNPSANYSLALAGQKVMSEAATTLCNITHADPNKYNILFTSGASESNNHVIYGIVAGYRQWVSINKIKDARKPVIILSSIEHKTSINKAFELCNADMCAIDLIPVDIDGTIDPIKVNKRLHELSISGFIVLLVSVMSANNETGAMNNIVDIAKYCFNLRISGNVPENYKILFHTDTTAIFGKFPIDLSVTMNDPDKSPLFDAVSLSYHKIYGPTQCGALIINKRYINTGKVVNSIYLMPLISGTQNFGMRGGTENISLIAGANAAMIYNFKDRISKNKILADNTKYMLAKFAEKGFNIVQCTPDITPAIFWSKVNAALISGDGFDGKINLILINALPPHKQMPHVILCAFIYSQANRYCAVDKILLRDSLYEHKVIVSTGSACSRGSNSYVLNLMGLPDLIKNNPIRISIGDINTREQIDLAVISFTTVIQRLTGLTLSK